MAKGYGLAGQIDNYLKQKGSPMAGLGKVFVAAGKKHGVDPRLVVGISGAESSFGKHLFAPHNAWGWMSDDRYDWGSWEYGINTVTAGLAKGYISQGLRTPADIVKKYAPGSAGNDEGAWSGNVSTFMKELGASPLASIAKTTVASGPSAPPPPSAVPGFKLPAFPELPPLEPSTSGIRGALIANLGLTAQRGHSSGAGLLAGVLQGQLADTQADEAASEQRKAYEQERDEYTKALQAAMKTTPDTAADTTTTTTAATAPASADTFKIPVSGKIIGTPGAGTHTRGNWESDNAVDIAIPKGTPIRAVADGVIGPQFGSLNSDDPALAGLRLHISTPDNANNFYYAHLSSFAEGIKPGAQVKAGQVIGYSGAANGVEHLHFAERQGNPLDRYEAPANERLTRAGKPHPALAEAFYDPLGSWDSGRFGGAIGNHSDHVHLSVTDPQLMLSLIKKAQEMGLSVRENPYVDPVDPVHVEGSFHYRTFPGSYGGKKLGEAIDVSGSAAQMAAFYRAATGT